MCTKTHKENKKVVADYDRSERRKMFEDFNLKHDALLSTIDNLNGKGNKYINKESLRDFPLMEWVQLNPKVRFRQRNPIMGDILVFDTEISAGGEFGLHVHDCDEVCDIIKGDLVDLMSNREAKEGETIEFKSHKDHIPISLTDTVLKVYFK